MRRLRHGDWGTASTSEPDRARSRFRWRVEGEFDRVIATDISLDALDVAAANAAFAAQRPQIAGRIPARLAACPVSAAKSATSIVSNPPYISFAEIERCRPSVRDWEPPLALFSGHDGMAATREHDPAARRRFWSAAGFSRSRSTSAARRPSPRWSCSRWQLYGCRSEARPHRARAVRVRDARIDAKTSNGEVMLEEKGEGAWADHRAEPRVPGGQAVERGAQRRSRSRRAAPADGEDPRARRSR